MDDAHSEGLASDPAIAIPLTENRPIKGHPVPLSKRDPARFARLKKLAVILILLRRKIDIVTQLESDAVVRHRLRPNIDKKEGPADIAGVHAYLIEILDALDQATDQIRANATRTKPLPLRKLQSVTPVTLRVLCALAAAACDGIVLTYTYGSVTRTLPILPKSMLSDVSSKAKKITIEEQVKYIGRTWGPDTALIQTISGMEFITRWPFDEIRDALNCPHILRGTATLNEESGALVLDEGAVLEPKRDLLSDLGSDDRLEQVRLPSDTDDS
ncbi:MAG: hypothetical protein KGO02_11575 [Alphaproteobacteria bacterium]|nr:hypothetical protein [Alphaproteobacteria bacterium]